VDWELWRIVCSSHFKVSSPGELLSWWTMEEVVDAHLLLDMYADMDEKTAKASVLR